MDTFTTLRATITDWKVEEGEKVVESVQTTDVLATIGRAVEILAAGRVWLSPWRSVDYTHTPVRES